MPKKEPIETVLEVHSLNHEAEGIAHYAPPGKMPSIVNIPFTSANEIVKVRLLKKRAGIYASRLLEVQRPSSTRIAAACRHFGDCGGCKLQHLPYTDQLVHKQTLIENLFKPFMEAGALVLPILAASSPWRYRNKMEFSFMKTSQGECRLGLFQAKSCGWVTNLVECHLSPSWFSEALDIARQWREEKQLIPYYARKDTGSLRTLTLREGVHSKDRMVILTVSGHPDFQVSSEEIQDLVVRLTGQLDSPSTQLSVHLCKHVIAKGIPSKFIYEHLHGPKMIREELSISIHGTCQKLTFKISPRSFFQPNTLQAELLYRTAVQMAGIHSQSVVYDLYCGTGTLGMFASKTAKEVIGIELNPEAIADAYQNIKENQISNMRLIQGDVGQILTSCGKELPTPDIVIVDPPRAGLDPKAIENLLLFNPKQIIYISCNPLSQVKNVKEFIEAGYQLKAVQPVEQFPHTHHIENIAILEKKA